jgi:hypothetical protein
MIHRFNRRRKYRSRQVDMQSYSVQCDRSGFRANASDCVREWDGKVVLKEFSEQRHPMDFFRVPKENPAVPIARPRDTSNTVDQTAAPNWGME